MELSDISFVPPEFIATFQDTGTFLGTVTPYVLPLGLLAVFIITWRNYVVAHWVNNLDWVLLEIKLPREIEKSPQAMEVALSIMHLTSSGEWTDHWWKGRRHAWFSLEIASIDGHVHFYVYTQKFHQKLVTSHFYSQYPEVEVVPVDDYTRKLDFSTDKDNEWDLWGVEWKLAKPDPYPIKTYIDYGLDKKNTKEERSKVDPITPLIEFFGTMGKGEQLWYQILVRSSQKKYDKGFFTKGKDWKDKGIELVKTIRKPDIAPGQTVVYDTKLLTPGEQETVKSIERGISKLGFDVGLRGIYLAKKEVFNPSNIVGLVMSGKQYNTEDMNGFKPNDRYTTDFDFPWQDFMGIRLAKRKRYIFEAFRKRSYFYPPYERPPMVFSIEELATLYHFPGGVSETPTVHRIPSKTGEPPRDLPR